MRFCVWFSFTSLCDLGDGGFPLRFEHVNNNGLSNYGPGTITNECGSLGVEREAKGTEREPLRGFILKADPSDAAAWCTLPAKMDANSVGNLIARQGSSGLVFRTSFLEVIQKVNTLVHVAWMLGL